MIMFPTLLPVELASLSTLAKHYPSYDTEVQWLVTSMDANATTKTTVLAGQLGDVLDIMEKHYEVGLQLPEVSAPERLAELQEDNGNVVQFFVFDMKNLIQVI